jgi:hypothetical protein
VCIGDLQPELHLPGQRRVDQAPGPKLDRIQVNFPWTRVTVPNPQDTGFGLCDRFRTQIPAHSKIRATPFRLQRERRRLRNVGFRIPRQVMSNARNPADQPPDDECDEPEQ